MNFLPDSNNCHYIIPFGEMNGSKWERKMFAEDIIWFWDLECQSNTMVVVDMIRGEYSRKMEFL